MKKDWKNIKVSFGSGSKVPIALKNLKSKEEGERESAYWQLTNLAVLQSDLYEAAYYLIEPLLQILEDNLTIDKFHSLDILYEIFNGCAGPENIIELEDGKHRQLTMACRNKLQDNKFRIDNIQTKTEKELVAKNDLIESMNNPPEMFPSKESALEILKILGVPPSAAGL